MAKVYRLCRQSWVSFSKSTPKFDGDIINGSSYLSKRAGKLLCAVPFLTATGIVYAGSGEDKKEKNLVKVADVSLYNNPEQKNSYCLKEEKYETLRGYVNTARISFEEFMEPQWDRIEDVKDKIAIGKAHSAALVERLRTDKELQRKITIVGGSSIGAAGIGFSVVERGKKGSALTLLFGLLGGTIAMMILHPNQTLALIGFSPEDFKKEKSDKK